MESAAGVSILVASWREEDFKKGNCGTLVSGRTSLLLIVGREGL